MTTNQHNTEPSYNVIKYNQPLNDGNYIYNFEGLPQDHNYVKVHNLFLKEDKRAIKHACNILGNLNANIKIIIKNI